MHDRIVACHKRVRHRGDNLKLYDRIVEGDKRARHSGDNPKMHGKIEDRDSKQADTTNGCKRHSSLRTISSLDNQKGITEINEAINTSTKVNIMNSNRKSVAA